MPGRVKLIAIVVVVLLVGVFAVVLVQGHTPSTARSSRPCSLDYLLWTAESNLVGAFFGWSVSSAGDVNNDGYDDVVIGAYNAGRAYLYLSSSAGPSATPSWIGECDQWNAYFGICVSSAGDVNNDNYDDVVVGTWAYDNGEPNEGRAYLYLGSSTGLSATPSWTAESDRAGAFFGWSVSNAGDVNNDGYDDVVVGAYAYDNGKPSEGRAYLYLGSSAGLSVTPSWTADGKQEGAVFGCSVSDAGDVNDDGYDDIIVGAAGYDPGGCAYLYLGSNTGLSAKPSWVAEGNVDDASLGRSVSSAGDVNNDGYDDVVVGAPMCDNGQLDEGRAYLYLGSSAGLSATPSWIAESDQDLAQFGWSASSAGDVNNDGYDDVVVGAHLYDNGQSDEGRAYLYLGSSAGLSATPSWIGESDEDYAEFGCSVSSGGDVNGDGYDEVIVGAYGYSNGQSMEGRAYVYGEVVITEFSILLIPAVGAVAIVVALRRHYTSAEK